MSLTNSAADSPSSLTSSCNTTSNNNNNKYLPHYLHPDYLDPLSSSMDPKQSPLALLAETCNNIGKDLLGPVQTPDRKSNHPKIHSTTVSPSKKASTDHHSNRHSPRYNATVNHVPDTSTFTPTSSSTSSTQHSPVNATPSPNIKPRANGHSPRDRSRSPISSLSLRKSQKSPLPVSVSNHHPSFSSSGPFHSPSSFLFGHSSQAATSNFLMTSLLSGMNGGFRHSQPNSLPQGPYSSSMLLNNPWSAALMAAHTAETAKSPCTDPFCPYCHVTHRPCACLQCLQQKLMSPDPYTSAYMVALQQQQVANHMHQQQQIPTSVPSSTTLPKAAATAEYCIYCGKHCPSAEDLLTHMQLHLKKEDSSSIDQQQTSTSPSSLSSFLPSMHPPPVFSRAGIDAKTLSPTTAAAIMAAAAASRQFNHHQGHMPFRPPMPSSLAAHLAYPFGAGLV